MDEKERRPVGIDGEARRRAYGTVGRDVEWDREQFRFVLRVSDQAPRVVSGRYIGRGARGRRRQRGFLRQRCRYWCRCSFHSRRRTHRQRRRRLLDHVPLVLRGRLSSLPGGGLVSRLGYVLRRVPRNQTDLRIPHGVLSRIAGPPGGGRSRRPDSQRFLPREGIFRVAPREVQFREVGGGRRGGDAPAEARISRERILSPPRGEGAASQGSPVEFRRFGCRLSFTFRRSERRLHRGLSLQRVAVGGRSRPPLPPPSHPGAVRPRDRRVRLPHDHGVRHRRLHHRRRTRRRPPRLDLRLRQWQRFELSSPSRSEIERRNAVVLPERDSEISVPYLRRGQHTASRRG
mmetsp:Transcript_17137/g.49565  ORF Transcript_17137/g.49565 Transcript_17137/m.49565 type:complete len:346 (+) Transcript_17137:678-1715(+)